MPNVTVRNVMNRAIAKFVVLGMKINAIGIYSLERKKKQNKKKNKQHNLPKKGTGSLFRVFAINLNLLIVLWPYPIPAVLALNQWRSVLMLGLLWQQSPTPTFDQSVLFALLSFIGPFMTDVLLHKLADSFTATTL